MNGRTGFYYRDVEAQAAVLLIASVIVVNKTSSVCLYIYIYIYNIYIYK